MGFKMKKTIIVCLFATIICTFAQAKYNEGETASVDALKSQGFSENTLILQDKVNYYNGGLNNGYQRIYQKKEPKSKLGKAYTYLKNYVDPVQDDGDFFEHQINFTNSWTKGIADYARTHERVNNIENL